MTTPNELINTLNWRYATKQFDPNKKLSDETLSALKESLRLTPSSIGLQPWKFVVVRNNTELREKLKAASWNQPQITDADSLIVLCRRTDADESLLAKFIARVGEVQNQTLENLKPLHDMMAGYLPSAEARPEWTTRQVYIALGQLMHSCADLRVDACPLEGIEAAKYDEILGLEDENLKTVVACAIGYRHADDRSGRRPKVRFVTEDVFLER